MVTCSARMAARMDFTLNRGLQDTIDDGWLAACLPACLAGCAACCRWLLVLLLL